MINSLMKFELIKQFLPYADDYDNMFTPEII